MCVCVYLYAAGLYTSAFTQFVPQVLSSGGGWHTDEELLGFLVRVLPEEYYRDDLCGRERKIWIQTRLIHVQEGNRKKYEQGGG